VPAPPVTVRQIDAPSPPPSPLAYWTVDADAATLGLPDLGSVRVSATGVDVLAPDQQLRDATWARLGAWAVAQVRAAQGSSLIPGCVVARADKAVLITGLPRHGSTLLGLQLTRHGYGLVSDGHAVVDEDGRCLQADPWAVIDAQPAGRLFADYAPEYVRSGRERARVQPPAHADAELGVVINVRVKESLNGLAVSLHDSAKDGGRYRLQPVRSAVPRAPGPGHLPWTRLIAISRPSPSSLDELRPVSPIAMAERLAPLLDDLLA
jgi:hypothetical protein